MKNIIMLTGVVLACSMRLNASDAIKTQWNEVCRVATGRELTFTTADGATLEGTCISINVDGVSVSTKDNRVVKVARASLTKIKMHRGKRPLKALGRDMHDCLKQGFDWLFSEYAPLGIVLLPGTLAWGAIAAPFSLLGELKARIEGDREIKVM